MDTNINEVLYRLNEKGHEAYIVGGAVRDILLGKIPYDFDITTSATPDEVIAIFSDHGMYLTGLKHGTVSVIYDKKVIEITTFRKDGHYRDSRHPDEVYFTKDVTLDLKRRDFTINTFLMDKDEKIYDLLKAKEDLDKKLIRTVGEPKKRFEEDALRILRAIRFKAELGFKIEEATAYMIHKLKDGLHKISKERVATEFIKTLKASYPEVLEEYHDVYAGLIKYHYTDKLKETNDNMIKLALLFKDDPSDLNKLFLSKKDYKTIMSLIQYQNFKDDDLSYIFTKVDNDRYISYIKILKDIDLSDKYQDIKDYIVTTDTLAISSLELMALGYKGKALGNIKKELIAMILQKKLKNDHLSIMTYLKEVL